MKEKGVEIITEAMAKTLKKLKTVLKLLEAKGEEKQLKLIMY